MKHRLTEFLASQLGFTIFSIEANMPEAYRLNDYVLYGKGEPKALLQGMYFWTWNTEEVLAMIEWMRGFNASGKGRIEFTGFDMQTARVAMQNVQDLLRKVDPEYATKVEAIYRDADSLKSAQSPGFGVATATFPVHLAAGKRIKFSGAIRTRDLEGFAGLWWRADGPKGTLAFDNMQTRGPTGTTDWKRYEIVLDMPADTVNINFGAIMPGTGTAWFDDLQLEIDGKPYNAAGLFDFDFESGQPRGFFLPASGYTVRVDDGMASRGTRSLRIQSQARAATSRPSVSPADASRRLAEVVADMEKARGEYSKRANTAAVAWAIQNARVVHQCAQMTAGEVTRDESMARNVKWILDTAPKGTRVVLWAHNGHVGRVDGPPYRTMGSYLNDWYGKEHVVVGFAVNRGEYTAVGRGTGLGRHQLTPAAAGSFEYAFARAGMPRFILDLRAARADTAASGWLTAPMQFRSIGAMAMENQFHPVTLSTVFDLMVFLDETTPTRGLWTQR
jgi:erythromycin esterase-like protein